MADWARVRVEPKAGLTLAERDALLARLAAEGSVAAPTPSLRDAYVEAKESPTAATTCAAFPTMAAA